MFEKILKIGGLCLLGVGGFALVMIPGLGWVVGPAALVMIGLGAAAIVGTMWGSQAYVEREQQKTMEAELTRIEHEMARLQSFNESIKHEKEIAKLSLASTAMLKNKFEQLSVTESIANQDKDDQIDQLQRALQTVTGDRDTLKMRLEESGVKTDNIDELSPLMTKSMGR